VYPCPPHCPHGVCTGPEGCVFVAFAVVVGTGAFVVVGTGVGTPGPFFVVVDFTVVVVFFVVLDFADVVVWAFVVLIGAGLLVDTGEGGRVDGGTLIH